MSQYLRYRLLGSPVLAVVAICFAVGCGGPRINEQPLSLDAQQSWREDRLQLSKLHRSGVCELRWTDDQGKRHFEPQVDCDLWWQPPEAFALQFSKLGETLGWVGGDGERLWLFDLLSQPTQLVIIEPEAAADATAFGLPLAGLLDGWQLRPFSPGGEGFAELVETRLGRAKLFALDPSSPPSRLETVDGNLEVAYDRWSLIDRAAEDTNDRGVGQWFPERVQWTLRSPEATATFWLREPRRALEKQRWNRLFDLERLRRSFLPQTTSVLPSGASEGVSAKTADF